MPECQPIGAIGHEGIMRIRNRKPFPDAKNPRGHAGMVAVQKAAEQVYLHEERESGQPADDQTRDEERDEKPAAPHGMETSTPVTSPGSHSRASCMGRQQTVQSSMVE